jgi:hypothetical protein
MQYSSMKTAVKRNKLIVICYGRHSGALTHLRGGSAKLALLAGSSVTRYHAANPQPIT